MPLFEYRCADCQKRFTLLVGMSAEATALECPHCKSAQVSKLISRPAKFRTEQGRVDEIADRIDTVGEDSAEMSGLIRDLGHAMDEDMADELEELYDADMTDSTATAPEAQ